MSKESSDKGPYNPWGPPKAGNPSGLIASKNGTEYLEGRANEISSHLREMELQNRKLRRDIEKLCDYHESRHARLQEKVYIQVQLLREDLGLDADPRLYGCVPW